MTPTEITPVSVLFDLAKRQCGVSHKELATMLLSGRPLSDGRSPQSRVDDRTWVSRFIVHAPVGTLTDRYFCDYTVGALRLAARMKSRSKRALSGEAILDIVCGEAGRAMDDALRVHGQNPALYRNMLARIACEGSLSADERAEVALVGTAIPAGPRAGPAGPSSARFPGRRPARRWRPAPAGPPAGAAPRSPRPARRSAWPGHTVPGSSPTRRRTPPGRGWPAPPVRW